MDRAASAVVGEAPAWQILPKPCGSLKFYSCFSHIMSDNPPARNVERLRPLGPLMETLSMTGAFSHPKRDIAADGLTPFRILITDNREHGPPPRTQIATCACHSVATNSANATSSGHEETRASALHVDEIHVFIDPTRPVPTAHQTTSTRS